jgi:hypothetical protein
VFVLRFTLIDALYSLFRMGALTSRQHAGVEEVDIVSNHAYKYPPRSGMSRDYGVTLCKCTDVSVERSGLIFHLFYRSDGNITFL